MQDVTNGLQFISGGIHADLHLRAVTGREQIGQLYEFRLLLRHDPGLLPDEELDQMLLSPCAFTLGPGEAEAVHGIIREIELVDSAPDKPALYSAVVVPTIWLLTLSKISRTYKQQTVVQMTKELLTKYQFVEGEHFEIKIAASESSGPKHEREFCMQYDESDWDFIQRWLEQEGFSYWFQHREAGETVIIADGVGEPIVEPSTLPYSARGGSTDDRASIHSWRVCQRRIPARVVLKDYNYRNPGLLLVAPAVVDTEHGFGTQFEYGDHFRDDSAGKALARRRAERIRCTRETFMGVTDCRRFRVGHTFTMDNHFDARYDQRYLITAIEHRVGTFSEAGEFEPYRASFEAISAGLPFRPARVAPWPSIYGVMHAHVDADDAGEHATLDDHGRYRVRFPFDSSGGTGGRASHCIRMAQSYSGPGYGNHFPLHKGAEVLVAFLDGDPDRPVIVGAVPNPQTISPATSANSTQSVIQTASGIRIQMEDKS